MLGLGFNMFSIKMIGTIRSDQFFRGMMGQTDLTAQDLPPVEISDAHLFSPGIHGGNSNTNRVQSLPQVPPTAGSRDSSSEKF